MAVYTEVDDEQLQQFLERYDIGGLVSVKGVAEGVENSNFFIQTERDNYFLTIYEKRVNPADLPFFLGLMQHIAAKGIPSPLPIAARDGTALHYLAGKPAVITSFLSGFSAKRPTATHCAQVGAALAHLHLATVDFTITRQNALSLAGWQQLIEATVARADEVQAGLAALISQEYQQLQATWPESLPQGVIHADLFPDNVFFLHDELSGMFDFYFACNDAFAYDLAVCVNAWCFERDDAFNITKARRLIEAYDRVRPIGAQELSALPYLCRGAALRFLLTRLYDWLNQVDGALVTPKNPLEYVHKLEFHQRVKGPGAYGLG